MSIITRLHHVHESTPKDRYVEIRTSTSKEELRRIAGLEHIELDRLVFVERLIDGEFGMLDTQENIFYRTAKDVERGSSTYGGTVMVFEDPEVKKWLVANIGGERGITNSVYGKVGVKGIAGEVTYEQVLATRYIDFSFNKSIRRFNELVYFKNLTDIFFRESTIEELSLPYMSISKDLCFYSCTKLRKLTTKHGLDIRGSYFLSGCLVLSDIDTGRWTFSGSSTERMFENCKLLTRLDLRNLGMKNVSSTYCMFLSCTSLREVLVDGWNLERLSNAESTFLQCTSLQSLDTSKWNLGNLSNGTNMFNGCTSLQSLDTSKWNLGNLSNGTNMFNGCTSLQSLDTSKWNLGNLSNGTNMFNGCTSLQSLDTSKWNLGNLSNGTNMFSSTAITTLDVRNWDLRKLIDATYMFYNTPLISLDTSGWRLSSLLSIKYMFQLCRNLISLGDTSRWGIEKLTDATATFHYCNALQSLDTSGWSLENVTTMQQTFDGCWALTSFGDTSKWNPIRCTNYMLTFQDCRNLIKVDLSYKSSPLVNASSLYGIINESKLIESLVGDHTETDNISIFNGYNSTDFNLTPTVNLNLASILAVIRGLGTNRTKRKFIPPQDFDKSRIPQEYKTMLENKNWELV